MKLIECNNTHNILKVMDEVVNVDDKLIIPNSKLADVDAHTPKLRINGSVATIYMDHPMDPSHYIKWIMVEYPDLEITKYFKPYDQINLSTNYSKDMKIYAYCNKDGLWMNESK